MPAATPPRHQSWSLAAASDLRSVLGFLKHHGAPPSVLDHAETTFPGLSILVRAHRSDHRLLGLALVDVDGDTATLWHLDTSRRGPSLREIARWVPMWCAPRHGIKHLWATDAVPRRALGRRWRRTRHGRRYRPRPGERPAPCPLCARPRLTRADVRRNPDLVCDDCDARALDRSGRTPALLDEPAAGLVYIDGRPCTRLFRFGGWITLLGDWRI